MPDLLVKLYGLNFDGHRKEYFDADIKIVRALTPDKTKVLELNHRGQILRIFSWLAVRLLGHELGYLTLLEFLWLLP